MGCLVRMGCLVILAIAAVFGWLNRDRWMPARYRARIDPPAGVATWEPLTDAGAQRTRAALDRLSRPAGPVFETLSGADIGSYVFRELARSLPASADSVQSMVIGDQISMRAVVNMSDLGSAGGLGALGGMLGGREHVQLTGTIRVVKPGLGEFAVQDVKMRGLSVPHGMIGTMIGRFSHGKRDPAVDADALPLPLPLYVGDIRVANGRITLYKNVK